MPLKSPRIQYEVIRGTRMFLTTALRVQRHASRRVLVDHCKRNLFQPCTYHDRHPPSSVAIKHDAVASFVAYANNKQKLHLRSFSTSSSNVDNIDQEEACVSVSRQGSNICDVLSRPKLRKQKSYNSHELYKEAVDVLNLLAGVGSVASVNRAFQIMNLLVKNITFSECMDAELLNNVIRIMSGSLGLTNANSSLILQLASNSKKVCPPSRETFATLLDSPSRGNFKDAEQQETRLRQYWKSLKGCYQDGKELLAQLDEAAENVMIQVHARNGEIEKAMEYAQDYIKRSPDGKISDDTFLYVLIAIVTEKKTLLPETTSFLDWSKLQYQKGKIQIMQDSISLFEKVLLQFTTEDTTTVQTLLGRLDFIEDGDKRDNIEDHIAFFEKAIVTWANAGELTIAERLWNESCEKLSQKAPFSVNTCNILLRALASSWDFNAQSVATSIIHRMATDMNGMKPNYSSYEAAIDCLYDSGKSAVPEEILNFFKEMQVASQERTSLRRPDSALIAKVAGMLRSQPIVLGEFLEYLTNEVRQGNTGGEKLILDVFHIAMSVDGDTKLFEFPPNGESSITLLRTLYEEKVTNMPPNNATYQLLMTKYLKSSFPEQAIDQLLRLFLLDLNASGPPGGREILYFMPITHFAARGDAEKVERYIEKMFHEASIEPSVKHYNQVLRGWSLSAAPRAAKRADAIIEHMKSLHGGHLENSKPNLGSYDSLMQCWQTSELHGADKRIVELQNEMQDISLK